MTQPSVEELVNRANSGDFLVFKKAIWMDLWASQVKQEAEHVLRNANEIGVTPRDVLERAIEIYDKPSSCIFEKLESGKYHLNKEAT